MPPAIDKELVRQRFRRCLPTYDGNATVQKRMAEQLTAMVRRVSGRAHDRTLEIGAGTGVLTRRIVADLDVRSLWVNDLVPECRSQMDALASSVGDIALTFLPGDVESDIALPGDLNLVASNAAFQWIEDLPRLLARLASLLRRGGVLAFTTFGPDNFAEIRELTGRTLDYKDADSLRAALPAGMASVEMHESRTVLRFASPRDAVEHIRLTGTNAVTAAPWTRQELARFDKDYRASFPADGGVTLTYHPIVVAARAGRER
jgi:malonyl-CoA O-methyltransferase